MKTFLSQSFFNKELNTASPILKVNNSLAPLRAKPLLGVLSILVLSNLISFFSGSWGIGAFQSSHKLYLLDKAAIYVTDMKSFDAKVREIAARLNVPPEWLMAVMYSESRFDASAENFKGSGAVGLIQFMPATAKDLGTSTQHIGNLSHAEQMEWVFKYMQLIRNKYGEYESLTDFYLAILYPQARRQEMCYVMYAHPSKSYKQNSGLDIDKDGKVTVADIDKRMKKLFYSAYIKRKPAPLSI